MTNVLFIDDRMLLYDQSAGARSSFMYLKLLADMGYKVTFFPYNTTVIEPYTSVIKGCGIKVLAGQKYQKWWKLWLKLNIFYYDVIFFNRPDVTSKVMWSVPNYKKIKKIYQCHDLHFLRFKRQFDITGEACYLKESEKFRSIENKIYDYVDVALTFSDVERDIIDSNFSPKKTVVVPLFFYDTVNPPLCGFESRKEILYVGGFKHAPNVDAVLWFVNEVLPLVRKHIPDLIFLVAGSSPPSAIKDIEQDGVKILGFVNDDQIAELYRSVRVVVVPIRFGAGVKGKVVEAIHNGIPLVSTSVGLEGIPGIKELIRPTDTPSDFADTLVELYRDESKLVAMSAALSSYAADNLGVAAARRIMSDILEK